MIQPPSIAVTFHTSLDVIDRITIDKAASFEWKTDGDCSPTLKGKIERWIHDYLHREDSNTQLPLREGDLTPFQLAVLEGIAQVPFGSPITYKALAEKVGKPKACQAVGSACGRNPFPLVIPCHRILAKGNKMGGFSLGLEIKGDLLDFEGIVYTA